MSQEPFDSLAVRKNPEEIELEKKRAELAVLEAQLGEQELALVTLQGELRAFERRYLSIVGRRYAELDEIEAQIAELEVHSNPIDPRARERATRARDHALESAQAIEDAVASGEQSRNKFKPSQKLKSLYREIAKRIHPDLATDDEERERRQRLMAEVNGAYEVGDEERLASVLREWESSPEAVKGDGAGAELVRVIRRIAQAENRLVSIKIEIAQAMNTDLYKLWRKAEEAEADGQDLLAEMAANVERDIALTRARLDQSRSNRQRE